MSIRGVSTEHTGPVRLGPRPGVGPARSLIDRLAAGEVRAALTFAGQGVDPLAELAALTARRPELARLLALAGEVLDEAARSPLGEETGQHGHGLRADRWVEDVDAAPPEHERRCAAISYPLIMLAQGLQWAALAEDGLAEAVGSGAVVAAAGHSQGTLGALLASQSATEGWSDEAFARYLTVAWGLGVHVAAARREARADRGRSPMAAVTGVRRDRLEELLDGLNRRLDPRHRVALALVNGPEHLVLSGEPESLALVRDELLARARREAAAARRGTASRRPLDPTWSALAVDVPFHSPLLDEALERFRGWLAETALLPPAASLGIGVLSPTDGTDLREAADLLDAVARAQLTAPVRWDLTTRALVGRGAEWVLDLGPGTAVARMSAACLRGRPGRVLALASPEGQRVLTTAGAATHEPARGYERFAPGVVELPDGTRHLDTRYTRLVGRPPVILAGMTPTTADVPIVAAAANAGYTAELAGGGQPDRETFERRMGELTDALAPGREVVFNALHLDPHLWGLHWDGDALVKLARGHGAPLAGMTVSAGIPDVEEATALLDELAELGMHENAFKPGTAEQVRRVLAIADANPHRTVIVHVEGGRAGGHHSWESLDEILLDTYDEARRRRNVVLCAGGGVGTPERAAELLLGSWSEGHGEPRMPVDAVLVGTAAMACAEASASDAVKRALVETQGADWVPRGACSGGVASARSTLGADIHLLDNAAARAGALIEEVAGDERAIRERGEEITEALARTAKPLLGDLSRMTYLELLARLTDLLAIGEGGRYEDGRWGHGAWRARMLEVYRRAAARLADAESGPVDSPVLVRADLDDPAAALRRFEAAFPRAASTVLDPVDADHLVAVCDGPGRPVPFVVRLDGDLRRRYLADSLWQAQDARFDADAVMVIPGPVSVRGIARVDEPVADLLERFESEAVEALRDEPPARRDRLADEGLGPRQLAALASGRDGALAAFLAAAATAAADGHGTAPNPLWRLARPTDRLDLRHDAAGRPVRLAIEPSDGGVDERVIATVEGEDVVVDLHLGLGGLPTRRIRMRRLGTGGLVEVADGRATLSMARAHLGSDAAAGADDPFEGGSAPWSLSAAGLAAYRASTGATHRGVPLDIAYALAWPALALVLGSPDLAPHATGLLHVGHRVRAMHAWPPREGESGAAHARAVEISDAAAGATTTLRLAAEIECERGALALVEAEMRIRSASPVGRYARRSVRRMSCRLDLASRADAEFLWAQPWLEPEANTTPVAESQPRVDVEICEEHPRGREPRWSARGEVRDETGRVLARIDDTTLGRPTPVEDALALLAATDPDTRPRPARVLAAETATAPASMGPYARASGDANPLHRSLLAARLAGLDGPIAHGAWTAARADAFLVEHVADGDPRALHEWRVSFSAPVATGAALELEATRIGVRGGARIVRVDVSADGTPAASGEAVVAAPRTALVFPGQGVQRIGLGAEARARSAAARATWERADEITRRRLGYSIAHVVESNPTTLRTAADGLVRHPGGVLHRTEVTQVALVVAAAAQIAELEAEGVLGRDRIAGGHSVGELSALHALGVIRLEDAIRIVDRRGRAMQAQVPRTVEGASGYGLAAVDPSAADLGADELEALVAELARSTGELLEIVNHNAPGRQYVVAGTHGSLGALAGRVGGSRTSVRMLPGIDVPFHSSALTPAVAELREELESRVGRVPADRLVERWVPNLVGVPFRLDAAFVADVTARTGSPIELDGDPDRLARELLVALLAHQVAAPVRWIETQRALVAPPALGGLGVRRVIEVGPGEAPVLTALARRTIDGDGDGSIAVLHSERDRDLVHERDSVPEVEQETETGSEATTEPGSASESPPPPAAAAPPDREMDPREGLIALLAVQARVRPEQIRPEDTLDDLFQGASSRRNQALVDLGRELGTIGGIDGVEARPVSELAGSLPEHAAAYRFPGRYMRRAIADALARTLSGSGLSESAARDHLARAWRLGPGLRERVLCHLALETREGPSARGGALGRFAGEAPQGAEQAAALLDRAVASVAQEVGVEIAPPVRGPAPAPASDGSAERAERAVLASVRALAEGLGRPIARDDEPAPVADPAGERLAILDEELGRARAEEVAPRLDPRRHVRIDSAWASARWDLVRCYHDARAGRLGGEALAEELGRLAIHGDDTSFAATALWLARQAGAAGCGELAALLASITPARRTPLPPAGARPGTPPGAGEVRDPSRPMDLVADLEGPWASASMWLGAPEARAQLAEALRRTHALAPDLSGEIALVSGASPGSIGAALTRQLLRGGATVVVATSTDTPQRRRWYRELYRAAAGPGAMLHVLPANLASFTDIDRLVDWLRNPQVETRGRSDLALGPLVPSIVAPFAAMPTAGMLSEAGPEGELALRLQVLGLGRLIGRLSGLADPDRPVGVIAPLSANHGLVGGDGSYSESKAALETLAARWASEWGAWGRGVALIAARIGWVRGTGLMGVNDALAGAAEERLGLRTFSADEVGWVLATAATGPSRDRAALAPLELDMSGGLAREAGVGDTVRELAAELAASARVRARRRHLEERLAERVGRDRAPRTISALPAPATPRPPRQPTHGPRSGPDPSEMVVIVGMGELGPGGTGRTRLQLELGGEISPGAVGELAWLCGLVRYEGGRFVDASTSEPVPEERLAERYRAAVRERVGVRALEADGELDPAGMDVLRRVTIDREIEIPVADEQEGRSIVAASPGAAELRRDPGDGSWRVVLGAGAGIRVPRLVEHTRRVVGQLPRGLDPARHGVAAELIGSADRMAVLNMATTAEAFWEAGLTPEQLLEAVHPASIANTQGAGTGGMVSRRRLLVDHMLDEERRPERLQESLGNVVAAHVVQGMVGSYGPMIHPVAACATAAVSLELAHDLIRGGRALAVLAGGFDDLSQDGLIGFADLGATADADELEAMGIAPGEASRPNDLRRRGFVEAQGGGSVLVVRGDVALEMGLPVRGVLAYAGSFADGIHSSIPGSGMGLLGCARGGPASPLAAALGELGLCADDIAVVSKHDTSTEMNDPHEADLHERIQEALGRTDGNPLLVVSQKSVTGHAKGGAAVWQVDGALRMMEEGLVPGNPNLECVDPALREAAHLALGDRPIRLADEDRIRCVLVSSLGFGHVSAIVALAHPELFVAAIPEERRKRYLSRAGERRAEGARLRRLAHIGRPEPVLRADRRLAGPEGPTRRAAEAAALLDATTLLRDGRLEPEDGAS